MEVCPTSKYLDGPESAIGSIARPSRFAETGVAAVALVTLELGLSGC